MELTNKVVLVTGAATGIGLAITTEFLKNGVKGVLLTDVDTSEGQKVLEALSKEFGSEKVSFLKVDVTNYEEYEGAFKKALEIFGRLDILVNNAGIVNEVNYELTIKINFSAMVKGTDLGMKYLGKHENGNGGLIINQASIAGLEATYPTPVYSATKHGIIGLVRAFGHTFHYNRTGVRVMALCAGKTITNIEKTMCLMPECLEEVSKYTGSMTTQDPVVVGRAAVYAVEKGEPGSLWVIEASKLYKANIPDRSSYSEFVMKLDE